MKGERIMTIKELYKFAENHGVEDYTLNIWVHDEIEQNLFYRKISDEFEIDGSGKEFDLFVEI
jgi:hypothetical protein